MLPGMAAMIGALAYYSGPDDTSSQICVTMVQWAVITGWIAVDAINAAGVKRRAERKQRSRSYSRVFFG